MAQHSVIWSEQAEAAGSTVPAGVREEIGKLQQQLRLVRSAPLPAEAQRELARQYTARLARQGRPKLAIVADQLRRIAGTAGADGVRYRVPGDPARLVQDR